MKKILLIAMALLVAAAACTLPAQDNGKDNNLKVCTEDAKLCPDGSAVGRNPENNCEFFPCPNPDEKPIPVEPDGGIGLTDPYTKYVSTSTEECKTILFQCIEGASPFSDDTGCGCKATEPKKYVSQDADECSRIRYMCEKNYIPFSDEDGCGCEFSFGEPENSPVTCTEEQKAANICTKEYMPVCGDDGKTYGNKCEACASKEIDTYTGGACPSGVPDAGKLKAIDCLPEQRNVGACTLEYAPVCGWNDPAKIQCIKYPCASTYGNKCQACDNPDVAYYTAGECPAE